MESFQNKVVLITGASSGIGEALAEEFARAGAHLILLARRTDRLNEIVRRLSAPQQIILGIAADVTRSGDIEHAIELARRSLPGIDVVIANAGFGVVGDVFDLSEADYRRQFETNVFGVLRSFWATWSELKKSRGRFVVIGSVNGYVALPGSSPYGMSKFAVRALCQSLRHEARPYGVSVTHIAPGFISTEIRSVNNAGEFRPHVRDPLPQWIQMPAKKAAQKIVKAVASRRSERIITVHGYVAVWLERHFPWIWTLAIRVFGIRARSQPKS